MPNKKISQLTDGNPAQANDQIPINRDGANFRITVQSIATTLGGVKTVVVSYSSADILAWLTTPKTVVAAQGAGTFILPLFYVAEYVFNATPYTLPDINASFNLTWDNNTGLSEPASFLLAGFIDQGSSQLNASTLMASGNTLSSGAAAYINKDLTINCAASLNPTVGDGTLRVTVGYQVLTL